MQDWMKIYDAMRDCFARDKELTHITIDFNIKPVTTDEKRAIVKLKTFRDEKES
jgi:hypothetical protein